MRSQILATVATVAVLCSAGCTAASDDEAAPSSVAASTSDVRKNAESATVFRVVIVRHAERANSGNDPDLTAAGVARADRLADQLGPSEGDAVYATSFIRSQQTARPTAQAWDVDITTYDPARDPATFAKQVRRDHPEGVVLIVGHSDTVPALVSTFCRCDVPPIAESDFGNLFWVDLTTTGDVADYQHRTDY